MTADLSHPARADLYDTPYAWLRLATSVALGTIRGGGVGGVASGGALRAVRGESGAAGAEVSFPYALQMLGFALGAVGTGRLADRFGITVTLILGAIAIGLGFALVAAGPALTLAALGCG